MSDKPLDLRVIENLIEMTKEARDTCKDIGAAEAWSDTHTALTELRASRIEINRLTAMAEADAFEIGRLVAENAEYENALRWAAEPVENRTYFSCDQDCVIEPGSDIYPAFRRAWGRKP